MPLTWKKVYLGFCGLGFAAGVWADAFTLQSNDFLDQGVIPVLYTCDGKDVSPQLSWANIPQGTQAFTLTLTSTDNDKQTRYHWLLYNLPKGNTSLDQGVSHLPAGATAGKTSANKTSYDGPCPPAGGIGSYVFNIYALEKPVAVKGEMDGPGLMAAMQGHILKQATLTAVYPRWKY